MEMGHVQQLKIQFEQKRIDIDKKKKKKKSPMETTDKTSNSRYSANTTNTKPYIPLYERISNRHKTAPTLKTQATWSYDTAART